MKHVEVADHKALQTLTVAAREFIVETRHIVGSHDAAVMVFLEDGGWGRFFGLRLTDAFKLLEESLGEIPDTLKELKAKTLPPDKFIVFLMEDGDLYTIEVSLKGSEGVFN